MCNSSIVNLIPFLESATDNPSASELLKKLFDGNPFQTLRDDKSVELLRQLYLSVRNRDAQYFHSLTIAELCAEIGGITHIDLSLEIALWTRSTSRSLLERWDVIRVLELIHNALASDNYRKNAIEILGTLPEKYALDTLLNYLSDPILQKQVIKALAHLGSISAIDPLIQVFHDVDHDTQLLIIQAFSQIQSPKAVEILTTTLQNENAAIQEATIWALGFISGEDAYDVLVSFLEGTTVFPLRVMFCLVQINPYRAQIDLAERMKQLPQNQQEYFNSGIQHQINARN
jgi:HEAT repeats